VSFNIAAVQRRLIATGRAVGLADGIAGPKTWAGIFAFVAQRPMGLLLPFGEAASIYLPKYGITENAARVANFVGQAAHESGNFRYMREIWGPTAAQSRYEGRADLGNTQPGDGRKYLGRGIFQLTGRANYREIGKRIGEDLEGNPTIAESPRIAVLTACDFWASRGLNALADAGDEDRITRKINGGTNGIDDRRKLVARAKGLLA
jgi:putative chitinase